MTTLPTLARTPLSEAGRRPPPGRLDRFFACRPTAALLLFAMLAGPAQAQQPRAHVVQPGETLWDISRQHLQSPLRWPELQKTNKVPVPELLRPGSVLALGGALAVVSELAGSAWLKRDGAAQQPILVGAAIRAGDLLVTEQGTFLSLVLADGSSVVIPSSSAVKVLTLSGQAVRFELLGGRLETHVEKQNGRRFEIRTRTSGLGVRGTHFRVRDEDGIVAVEVIEGRVAVTPRGAAASTQVLGPSRGARLEGGDETFVAQPLLPAPQRVGAASSDGIAVTRIDDAGGYRLQLALDEQFRRPVHEQRSAEPRFVLPATVAPGFYHLRLTAFDARQLEGVPGDSPLYVATGGPRQPAASRMSDGRYEISWPALANQRFTLELSRSPDFASPFVKDDAVPGGSVTVGPFDASGRYYWRSRANRANGAIADASPDRSDGVFEGAFEVPAP